jgi:hypothetical protein
MITGRITTSTSGKEHFIVESCPEMKTSAGCSDCNKRNCQYNPNFKCNARTEYYPFLEK